MNCKSLLKPGGTSEICQVVTEKGWNNLGEVRLRIRIAKFGLSLLSIHLKDSFSLIQHMYS